MGGSAATLLGVCLQLAGGAAAPLFVPATSFSLAWQHSIEQVRWEEDSRVDQHGQLEATAARIKGSAAGMEPPEDAVNAAVWYHYSPQERYPGQLRLTRSEFVPDYEWCDAQGCRPLSALLPRDGGVTLLWGCQAPNTTSTTTED